MQLLNKGDITPTSNIHYKTAYLDWRETCATELGVRFREAYPCDLTDCYGGSVGKIIRELARMIKLFRITGWPFRRALKRYFAAVHCIRRVSLAYFEKTRSLHATYMEWWQHAEKKWKEEDEQKRLQRKVPTTGPAAEKYRKLAENISMGIDDEVRTEALIIHLRRLKFSFMKKYSVWLKQYKAYHAEMKRRRRETMLLRHSKIGHDDPMQHARLEERLRSYRREFIKHIMSKPSIKLNPKAEKLDILYDVVDEVQAARAKKREAQLLEEFEKQKTEKLNKKNLQLNLPSLQQQQQQKQQLDLLKQSPSSLEVESPSRNASFDPSPLTPINILSPKISGGDTMIKTYNNNNIYNNNSNNNGKTTAPVPLHLQLDDNTNCLSSPSRSPLFGRTQKPKTEYDVIDIFARAPPPKPVFGQDCCMKSLKIDSEELILSLGGGGSGGLGHVSRSKKKQLVAVGERSAAKVIGEERNDSGKPPPLPPPPIANRRRRRRRRLPRSVSPDEPQVDAASADEEYCDDDADDDDDNDSFPVPPPVSSSARDALLRRINQRPPPTKFSPFQAFGARTSSLKTTSATTGTSGDFHRDGEGLPHPHDDVHGKIDDSAYEANVNRIYVPHTCPFRILDEKGLSEIDVSCKRIQRDAVRRAILNAKQIEMEQDAKRALEMEESRQRMISAKKGAGLSEKSMLEPASPKSAAQQQQQHHQDQVQKSPSRRSTTTTTKNSVEVLPSEVSAGMIQAKIGENRWNLLKQQAALSKAIRAASRQQDQQQQQQQSSQGNDDGELANQLLLASIPATSAGFGANAIHQHQQREREQNRNKFKFAPFSHSRFSANQYRQRSNFLSENGTDNGGEDRRRRHHNDDDDDEDADDDLNSPSRMTQEMLSNAVSTGSSWTPGRVITVSATTKCDSNKRESKRGKDEGQGEQREAAEQPSLRAIQPQRTRLDRLLLPSTKAWSSNVVSSMMEQQSQTQSQTQTRPPRGASESIFDYLLRTGVPAPTVEEMKEANRLKARQLRPLLEGKMIAASAASAASSSPSPARSLSTLLSHQHQHGGFGFLGLNTLSPSPQRPFTNIANNNNNNNNNNNANVLSLIQSVLRTSPPTRFRSSVSSQQNTSVMRREFDVTSMARTPPPYVAP